MVASVKAPPKEMKIKSFNQEQNQFWKVPEGLELGRLGPELALIHQIKTQCIFTVIKVYFKSNFYDKPTLNLQRM